LWVGYGMRGDASSRSMPGIGYGVGMRPRGTLLALAVLAASCANDPEAAPEGEAGPPAPAAAPSPAPAAGEVPADAPKAKEPAELPRVVYYVISET